MDSGGSYHITYMRDYLVDFEEYDGGNILFGDARECCVRGTSKVQVQMSDGSSFVLDNVSLSKVFWAEDKTMSTYLVNRSPSLAIGFKTPIDMLGFLGWLASIKQGMLKPVKVMCIFLRCSEGIVDNKLWRLDDVTSKEVQTQDLMDYQLAHDSEQHLACELFEYREDNNEAAFVVAVIDKIYVHESLTFNDTFACEVISKWKAGLKEDMDIRIHNEKLVQTLLEGHSILSLEDSLSGDCDVEKNGKRSYRYVVGSQEYQVICIRPDITSAIVDMLDGFDRGLQTNVQVFVDFDYAIGRSITVMSRLITWYGLMIQAVKEAIWLRGLLEELGVELNTVAVNCDNQGAIHLSRNHVFHKRTKHINVHYHFIREVLEAKTVKVLKVGIEHNAVDALTKWTKFESWQQRIQLYCKGKDHGEYIRQSIDEGPFKMGRCRDEVASGTDGPYLGPERERVGLPKDIYKLINLNTDAKDIWDNVKMFLEGSELTKDDRES
ncbi:hypothetical protein Tco_0090745 [Tanacetum coccineum]